MNSHFESMRARRYLLGQASDEECSAIEQEYLIDADVLDAVAAAEDDLIEDYLRGRLEPDERQQFQRAYLAAPHHRNRVETMRRLISLPTSPKPGPIPESSREPLRTPTGEHGSIGRRAAWSWRWRLALATAAGVAAAVWVFTETTRQRSNAPPHSGGPETGMASAPGGAAPAPPTSGSSAPAPPLPSSVLAVSIPPVSTRSPDDTRPVIIPLGTELVAVELQGEAGGASLSNARASVRTMTGEEVWQGAVAAVQARPVGVIGQIEIPAARLRPDDYVITTYQLDASGTETEQYRYFMRVRAQ